jgi:methenyltetrahydrofolate cyclohydrolase
VPVTVTRDARLDAGELVARLAAGGRSPAGGSAAAMAVAMAAALVEKAAHHSPDWPGARGAIAQARAVRRRAEPLVERCAEVYAAALTALESAGDPELTRRALAAAADVPLRIAEAGHDVALLACEVADLGEPALRPDAQVALLLAEAGTRAAARLVVENLGAAPDDPRRAVACELAATAAEARGRVEL